MMVLRILILLALFVACTPQPSEPDPVVLRSSENGGVTVELGAPPETLQEVPIRVILEGQSHENQAASLIARVDMPGMPMNVAPVVLRPTNDGSYAGTLVFTMSGPWFIEISSTGEDEWSIRHDISVP